MKTASVNEVARDTVIAIQILAGTIGIGSLWHARSFYGLSESAVWSLIACVVVFVLVTGLSVIVWDARDMVKWVALLDCVLLAALLHVTGGPTQSWFTPFLLVILPLKAMIEERAGVDNQPWSGRILFLIACILIYQLFGNWVIAKPDIPHRVWYHVWYIVTTGFTVFFPPMVAWGLIAKLLRRLILIVSQ